MFGSLGGPELLLILIIALIVFGPRKLPEMGKSLGKMLVEFRRASNEFKRTIEDEVEAEKIREQVQPTIAATVPTGPSGDVTPADAPSPASETPVGPVIAAPEGTVHTGDVAGEPH